MRPTLTLPGRALLDPLLAVGESVEGRRWVLPMVLVMLAVTFSGATFALKLDVSRQVLPKLAMKGDLQKVSEREISDEVQQAQRVALVAGVAKGMLAMPLTLLLLALVFKGLAWLLMKKVPFSAAFTVAAVGFLPVALFHLVFATALWQQDFVTLDSAAALVPSSLTALPSMVDASPVAQRVLGAVDFFKLWSAVLMGLGLGRAMGLKTWKSVLLGLGLYLLFACAFLVGLPGLAENFGPGAGGKGPRG